jgi:hypothetical protein
MRRGDSEVHGRSGVAGGHHDEDFVKRRDVEQGYEQSLVVGGSWEGDRTTATVFSHVHGRAMPASVQPRDRR